MEEGGLNHLDITSRNKAIEIIWLKAYLNISPTRPKWAKIMETLIDAVAPQGSNTPMRINMFLQTWKVNTRGMHHQKLNDDMTRMLNAAKNQSVNLVAIQLSNDLKMKLPAWFLMGNDHQPINNRAARCLINKHGTKTIADLVRTSKRLRDVAEPQYHRHLNFCNCPQCVSNQNLNCMHPYDCATEALARLNAFTPKTNPLVMDPNHMNLSLSPRRKEQNKNAKEENKGITFNLTITDKNELADCFRIFTDPEKISRSPAQCLKRNQHVRHNKITAHTNGACFNNGKANAACRAGIWFGNNDP